MKTQATEWGKILLLHIPTKSLHAEFINNAYQSERKKSYNPIKTQTRDLNRKSHKIKSQMANKHRNATKSQ